MSEKDLVAPPGSYVDMDGKPMSFLDWATLYGDKPKCVIAKDGFTRNDGSWLEVRTMWTGVSMGGELHPFGTVSDPPLTVLEEYPTKVDALEGHDRWVHAALDGQLPEKDEDAELLPE